MYRIFEKGVDVQPSPDETWPTREGAEEARKDFERDDPSLAGKLEVREEKET